MQLSEAIADGRAAWPASWCQGWCSTPHPPTPQPARNDAAAQVPACTSGAYCAIHSVRPRTSVVVPGEI